ncbi:MAG: 4-hydroxythreonine-4-phosphate dehydrogenase PdxA [Crocinitomicaceae bacterium]|nr:4-hydroxythreonine-4-phosphate dehydrogenase PdxA [Crocinitomicaceae bacterium]|tara:strand:+ start:26523 stop:27671 length:1149 start_codon:yes stop_codon:yes gene_type:complete
MENPKKVKKGPIRVGISIGDINGIGPEVIMKALNDSRMLDNCTIVIYGSSKVLNFHKKPLGLQDFNYVSIKSADEVKSRKINLINIWDEEITFELGKATESGGKYAFESLESATKDLASGKVDVLVTAPISKDAMGKMGFKFPGHTEYLADMAGQEEALMLMVSPTLRVGLVTSHIALKDVPTAVTTEKVFAKIKAFNESLKKDFGIRRPRIAVFGVNPHAGENGKMGSEESEAINPAIAKAKGLDILAFGPYPADGFFGSSSKSEFDGVLAMYHDQGLAAFKALSFDEGVNFTAGLPVIRTSPDHGTAFDIAGQNKASGDSMRNAIYLAMDVYKTHAFEKEINANPLEISKRDKKDREFRNDDRGGHRKPQGGSKKETKES